MKRFVLIAFIILSEIIQGQALFSKKSNFSKQDTLRGSITKERAWWDLTYYNLDIKVSPNTKYISGKNTIYYKVLKRDSIMQIDLQPPLKLTKATQNNTELNILKEGNAHYIHLEKKQTVDSIYAVTVSYQGHPKEAINAPWDGGISWEKDNNGNHFIASSCQGIGASVWWPCKDHMYDEVDSMQISVNVPSKLTNVSNGRLIKVEEFKDSKTYSWFVGNPINNYGVNINIGDYTHFKEVYNGIAGDLDMDFYVLRDNLKKAKKHFQEAKNMLKAFEYWFGSYPFYKDGYKLVEVPYLGMEHQSSVTYGNKYKKGYLGRDLSGTGWGLKFDFIIVHESAHEWFANSITNKDVADMWIHESFAAYSESLFLDYYYGKQAASEYIIGTRKGIKNDKPIIGFYNVNNEGSTDMYYKGANMLHTLRFIINNDEKWRNILIKLNKVFFHQTVTSKQVEAFLIEESNMDLSGFFNQYLRDVRIPTLEYQIRNNTLKYHWTNVVDNFEIPLKILINQQEQWITPKTEWQILKLSSKVTTLQIDDNFYVKTKRL